MLGLFITSRTLTVSSAALESQTGGTALQAVSLRGEEGINSLFEYQLTLQAPDAHVYTGSIGANLDLQALLGQAITCHIQLEGMGHFESGSVGGTSVPHQGGGERQISGLITGAQLLQEDPRHTQYQLTLRPWLHLASLKTDCKIFQDKTPIEVIEEVLASYPYAADKRLIESYPVRDYCVQYNESDLQFVSRLLQEWGINYHFEHSAGVHRLIWSDHNAAFQIRQGDLQQSADGAQDNEQSNPYHTIPYYPLGHKTDREYIHQFSPVHQLTASSYASADYDYTRPKASLAAQVQSEPTPTAREHYLWRGANGTLSASDYSQPNAGADKAANQTEPQGQHLARLRLQTLRQEGSRAEGSGHIRGIVPGSSFTLSGYPQDSANSEYLVLHTELEIENPSEHKTWQGESSQNRQTQQDPNQRGAWRIFVRFSVQPSTIALRPARRSIPGTTLGSTHQPKPLIPGPLSALVVGPVGSAGNSSSESDSQAQSPGNIYTDYLGRIKVHFYWDRHDARDHHSSCWVRVASPWAGNQLGAVHIPRIGQEVLVSFEAGDPDRPVVIGSLYNQLNQAPWSLPGQQALSGIRSRELNPSAGNAASGRSNHLLLDDTAEQIQVQLKSDHQHSSLSLGHITRVEDNAGRQEHRGDGFELRTDGHGAIRAQDGLLISTQARSKAQGHVKAMGETTARLSQAQDQHSSLGDLAVQHQAQEVTDQGDVAQALQAQNDAIAGKVDSANTAHPELTEPHLVLASPAGIESTTAGSTHQHSGAHHAISSGGHASVSAGRSWLVSAKEAVRLFAYKSGIKLISAKEDINIQALQQSVNVLAKMDITVTAKQITLSAKERVTLNGGGSSTVWDANLTSTTAGSHTAHAATHGYAGAQGGSVSMPKMAVVPLPASFSARVDASALHYAAFLPQEVQFLTTLSANVGRDKIARAQVKDRTGELFVYAKEPAQVQAALTRGGAWASEVEFLQEERES